MWRVAPPALGLALTRACWGHQGQGLQPSAHSLSPGLYSSEQTLWLHQPQLAQAGDELIPAQPAGFLSGAAALNTGLLCFWLRCSLPSYH